MGNGISSPEACSTICGGRTPMCCLRFPFPPVGPSIGPLTGDPRNRFSGGWWAESDGTQARNGQVYPRGTLFRIAEFYGWTGQPNQGRKMLAGDIAKKMVEQEKQMRDRGLVSTRIQPGPADASIF